MDPNDPISRLKNTTHINLCLGSTPTDTGAWCQRLLQWLNARTVSPVHERKLQGHLEQIERRRKGLDALPEVARRAGEGYLSAFVLPRRFMPHYGFAAFDCGVGHLVISVDILNAGGELGFPTEAGEIAEIFWVGRMAEDASETGTERDQRKNREIECLRQLVRDVVRDLDVVFVFGGHVSFVGRYASWLRSEKNRDATQSLPWDFLWPMTYLPECSLDESDLKKLPVYYAERLGAGAIIQVFEDLHVGYEDDYIKAAHTLGLRAIWELKPQHS
jgi:hypothetical protein